MLECWTTQLQEWTETDGGNSLLEVLYKALDEVSLILRSECELYPEAFIIPCNAGRKTSRM